MIDTAPKPLVRGKHRLSRRTGLPFDVELEIRLHGSDGKPLGPRQKETAFAAGKNVLPLERIGRYLFRHAADADRKVRVGDDPMRRAFVAQDQLEMG